MDTPISILIIADGYSDALTNNLPSILEQKYEADFEVVVVCESKKSESCTAVLALTNKYPNICYSFIPDVPKYITDMEVAIMLGTKAAKFDRIVVVHPTFCASSDTWLAEVAQSLECPLCLGLPYAMSKKSRISRYFHKKKRMKLIKQWLKERAIPNKQVSLPKASQSLFAIAYQRKEYLESLALRYFIFKYIS